MSLIGQTPQFEKAGKDGVGVVSWASSSCAVEPYQLGVRSSSLCVHVPSTRALQGHSERHSGAAAAMADDALDEKAKRVRSLLSSYYGTDGAGAGASAGGAGAPRLSSIDSV